jgi:very-short-patch-repair endonuclease
MRTSKEVLRQAKNLRQKMTPWERVVWEELRNRKFNGIKFRRQHAIGPYIVDFYCARHKLIIELDGNYHRSHQKEDKSRTIFLEDRGHHVIRFWNQEVEDDLGSVLGKIEKKIEEICN